MERMSILSLVRACVLVVIVFGFSWQSVEAQTPDGGRSMFRGFGGLGFVTGDEENGIFNAGFGGEGLIYKGLAVGADVGYLGPLEFAGEGFGNLNINGSYHFFNGQSTQKWTPFVTGGYTLFFREGTANLFNIGGGVTYWINPSKGVRFEVRDQIWNDYGTYHYVSFNVGFVF